MQPDQFAVAAGPHPLHFSNAARNRSDFTLVQPAKQFFDRAKLFQ